MPFGHERQLSDKEGFSEVSAKIGQLPEAIWRWWVLTAFGWFALGMVLWRAPLTTWEVYRGI